MRTKTRILLLSAPLILALVLTGCADPRTSNQGGGSIITVGTKLSSGNVGDLNADEWQILVDNLPTLAQFSPEIDLTGVTIPQLTDEQAAAIVKFLDDNNVQTLDDLSNLEGAELPPELQELADVISGNTATT